MRISELNFLMGGLRDGALLRRGPERRTLARRSASLGRVPPLAFLPMPTATQESTAALSN